MIDFERASVFKLSECDPSEIAAGVAPLLVEGEQLAAAYKGPRDHVVFTSKRIIAVNVQGITGKKKDFTSLPYSKIQAFSVETAGVNGQVDVLAGGHAVSSLVANESPRGYASCRVVRWVSR